MKIYLPTMLATLGSFFSGCGQQKPNASSVKTELGLTADNNVLNTFRAYKQKPKATHCSASGSGTHVLVSGFTLFEGVSVNLSGVATSALASPKFLDSAFTSQNVGSPVGDVPEALLTSDDQGARVLNRSVTIDGQPYELCVLTLDVMWDLAAAIIVEEASQFNPRMILMTGIGSSYVVFEEGAQNLAIQAAGYSYNGTSESNFEPTAHAEKLLSANPLRATTPMTWSRDKVSDAAAPLISDLGQRYYDPFAARSSNNYICNNVSYVVLAAALGTPLDLLGGKLNSTGVGAELDAKLPDDVAIGFMHFPLLQNLTAASVAGWADVLATIIAAQLVPADPT